MYCYYLSLAYTRIYIMEYRLRLYWFYRRQRAAYWRYKRLLFASPAEMALLRLMGGKAITIDSIKNRHTGFPFTIVTDMGGWFSKENMRREVRYGRYFCDFANDLDRIIEVDGAPFHNDITKEQDRADYFERQGLRVLHIKASDIFANPDMVQRAVIKFLVH